MSKSDRQRELRKERRAKSLCIDCGRPALKNHRCCDHHRKLRQACNERNKFKRKEEGRCFSCGRKLPKDEMLGKNKWACLFCQDRQEVLRKIRGR